MAKHINKDDPTNTLSNQPTTRRHPRDDPEQDEPTDVHDPHARDDPETPGFFERIRPKTWGHWSAVFCVAAILLAIVLYVTRLYPKGYHNPHVITIGILVGSYPFTALFFREQGFRARAMLDTVVIKLGSPTTGLHSMVTLGKVESASQSYRLVKEVKRMTYGGFVGSWLQLDDVLSDDDLELESKRHREPDDPTGLDLDGRFTSPTKTDLHGDVYVCDADDIDYDYESKDVERRTTPPAYIDEGSTGMLIKELQFAKRREDAVRNEITVVENQLESLRKRVDDETQPELQKALTILDKIQRESLSRRDRSILPEERSSSINDIDDEVDDEMNGGRS